MLCGGEIPLLVGEGSREAMVAGQGATPRELRHRGASVDDLQTELGTRFAIKPAGAQLVSQSVRQLGALRQDLSRHMNRSPVGRCASHPGGRHSWEFAGGEFQGTLETELRDRLSAANTARGHVSGRCDAAGDRCSGVLSWRTRRGPSRRGVRGGAAPSSCPSLHLDIYTFLSPRSPRFSRAQPSAFVSHGVATLLDMIHTL